MNASAPGPDNAAVRSPDAVTVCRHCGSRFHPEHGETFCSDACRIVHERIVAGGLEAFYTLSRGSREPVSASLFHPGDTSWLRNAQAAAEEAAAASGAAPSLTCGIEGITCLGCVWLVEELFNREAGGISCTISAARGQAAFRWRPGEMDLEAFASRLQGFGYQLTPGSRPGGERSSGSLAALTKKLGLCAAFAMNAMLFTLPHYLGMPADDPLSQVMDPITFALATGSMIVGGSYFIRRALTGLRLGILSIDMPIALGLIVAWCGSTAAWAMGRRDLFYFDFVAMFTFLMIAGRWIQERAASAARRAIERGGFQPGPVLDAETRVPAADVASAGLGPGRLYRVPPGGTVPVRSIVRDEAVELRLDWINGESDPRLFPPGALAPSGARVLGTAPALFEALEDWAGSRLATLIEARSAFAGRPGGRAGRVVKIALATVLALAFAGGLFHLLTRSFSDGLQVFVSVLVVSCPCAIGVAIPLCDELAAAAARRRGVILRDPTLWSRLCDVQVACFDKTGTITREVPELESADSLNSLSSEEREILLAMCWRSFHPSASALREALVSLGVSIRHAAENAVELPGKGIEWRDERGALWRLGRPGWSGKGEDGPGSVFSRNGHPLARFVFVETIRPETAATVRALEKRGLGLVLLSGDEIGRVRQLASRLGIPHPLGGLSPEGKAAWIRKRGAEKVLMIGDGGNDSLAFQEAGCRGTPASERGLLERNADFYLAGDRLGGVAHLFEIAERRQATIRRLIFFTIIYNTAVLIPALAGRMSPLLAAILMPVSSLAALAIADAGFRRHSDRGG